MYITIHKYSFVTHKTPIARPWKPEYNEGWKSLYLKNTRTW